jgi:hypothetical protein
MTQRDRFTVARETRQLMAGYAMGETANRNEREIRVGGARTYRGQHRYDGDLGGTLGFPVKLGLHTIPTLDPLMNHIPSGRYAPPTEIRYSSDICQSSVGAQVDAEKSVSEIRPLFGLFCLSRLFG